MSEFTFTPDLGATKMKKPKVAKAKFGDNYEQRQAFGLNTNLENWNLTFSMRDVDESDAIEAFLDARGGSESFDWTPPRASTARRFKCESYDRKIVKQLHDTITALFEEVAEPSV